MKHQCKLINVLNIGIACFWFLATLLVGVGLSSNPAQAQPFAYVTNPLAGTVSVIDTNPASADFNKVVSTIEVGENPDVITITPDGSHIYVVVDRRSVVVIDTSDNSVVDTLTMKDGTYWVAIAPSVAKNKGSVVSLSVSCSLGADCTRGNSSAHRMDTKRRK